MRKWIYITFGVVFTLFLVHAFFNFHYGIAIASAIFFPAFFLVFLYNIDVFERERFKDILLVFLMSFCVSFLTCLLWVPLRELLIINFEPGFFHMLFGAGLPEELIKIIPVLIVLKKTKLINEPIDYLIYASSSALGFAFMENIDYIYMFRESSPNIIAIRSLLPTFMHMACSSVFAFGIFFYMETKKIKYLFIFYFIAAATHAFYNSYLTHLIIIFIILYYARLIRALISISPFYDEKKIKLLKKGAYILGASFVGLHVVNIAFITYYGEFYKLKASQQIWFTEFIYLFFAFVFYKIISYNLNINKGEFKILGKRKIKLFSEMQQTVIKNYYAKINFHEK